MPLMLASRAMKKIILSLAAAASFGGAAPALATGSAETFTGDREVRVPFLHIGRMRTFRATDDRNLYIRATNRRWYRVTTMSRCPNLPWARAIAIDNVASIPWLDRFSTLIVEDDRCPVQSVVESGEPPKRERRARR